MAPPLSHRCIYMNGPSGATRWRSCKTKRVHLFRYCFVFFINYSRNVCCDSSAFIDQKKYIYERAALAMFIICFSLLWRRVGRSVVLPYFFIFFLYVFARPIRNKGKKIPASSIHLTTPTAAPSYSIHYFPFSFIYL